VLIGASYRVFGRSTSVPELAPAHILRLTESPCCVVAASVAQGP